MLQKTFKARFYDGSGGQGITVDVTWMENSIHIDQISFDGHRLHVEWPMEAVISKSNSSAILSFTCQSQGVLQQLDITDQAFIAQYRSSGKPEKNLSIASRIGFALIGFVLLLVLLYIFVLPPVADRAAGLFPKEYEIALGKQMAEAQLQGVKIDQAKTKNINLFFKQIKIPHDYPINIVVVDEDVPNAYAMPGGHIVVYSKMLNLVEDETALAALLAHEFSHIQLKHTTRGLFRNLAGTLFLSILFSDASGITGVIVRNGHELNTLSYTRELEAEADENALKILDANRINTQGMVNLFKTLKKAGGPDVNEMLSTHPDLENRIQSAKVFQPTLQPKQNDSLNWYFNKMKSKEWN